jgi:hypothetical protein
VQEVILIPVHLVLRQAAPRPVPSGSDTVADFLADLDALDAE